MWDCAYCERVCVCVWGCEKGRGRGGEREEWCETSVSHYLASDLQICDFAASFDSILQKIIKMFNQ
jgi:hypothetical protein